MRPFCIIKNQGLPRQSLIYFFWGMPSNCKVTRLSYENVKLFYYFISSMILLYFLNVSKICPQNKKKINSVK